MELRGIVDEDFSNYKKCSMFLIFPRCTLKCDKESGCSVCQNSSLLKEEIINVSIDDICKRYVSNPLSHSIVCGGLEPFDSFDDLVKLIRTLRFNYHCYDDVVIYTGYTEEELKSKLSYLKYKHCLPLYIKFGRFRPNQSSHFDEILGVDLANDEQYCKKVE